MSEYYYNEKEANKAITFIESFCYLVDGRNAGKPVSLEPVQKELISQLYGWREKKTEKRKYKTVFFSVGKKNGKSPLASWIMLYELSQGEGKNIYNVATTEKQAGIIFNTAKKIIGKHPILKKHFKVTTHAIQVPKKNNYAEKRTGVVRGGEGYVASCVFIDELHQFDTPELFQISESSLAAADDPLLFITTTAGTNLSGIGYEIYERAKKIKDGIEEDPTFLPFIFEAEKSDAWDKEETWKKANPLLGITVSPQFLKKLCIEAKNIPSKEASFRQKHLNQWVSSASKWLSNDIIEDNDHTYTLEDLKDKRCWLGLDMSHTQDMTAITCVFKAKDVFPDDEEAEGYVIYPIYFLPGNVYEQMEKQKNQNYKKWVEEGYLLNNPHKASIQHEEVLAKIEECIDLFNVVEIIYDKQFASFIIQKLERIMPSHSVFPHNQTSRYMTPATKAFEIQMLEGGINYNLHPIFRWNLEVAEIEKDNEGNIRPVRKHRWQKIDGLVAALFAISRVICVDDDEEEEEEVWDVFMV